MLAQVGRGYGKGLPDKKKKYRKKKKLRLFPCLLVGRTLYTALQSASGGIMNIHQIPKVNIHTHSQKLPPFGHTRTDRNRLRSGPPRREYYLR